MLLGIYVYYIFHNVLKTWVEAAAICENEGGFLASDNTNDTHDYLTATYATKSYFWIGLNDRAMENTWKWHNGNKDLHDPVFWDTNQPDDQGTGQDCVEFDMGKWNDFDCDNPQKFLCEKGI